MTGQSDRDPLVSFHGGHTRYDGRGEPEAFVQAAIRQGFAALGFSEHMPPPDRYTYAGFPPRAESMRRFESYIVEIQRLKEAYRADLPILLGVETEYLPDEEPYVADFVRAYPFDYVVGSVHYIRGLMVDYTREIWTELVALCGGRDAMVEEYYRIVRGLLAMGISDVLGHLDLVKIFAGGPLDSPRIRAAEDETLCAAASAGVVLDVNARGLMKPCAAVYPTVDLLSRARALGIPATLGDDAHAPEQVGLRLDASLANIRAAGYTSIAALFPENGRVIRRDLPLTIAP